LWLQRWGRWGGVCAQLELKCSRATYTEKPLLVGSILSDWGILHQPQVSFLGGEKKEILLVCY
jgi:hypothetical protein